MPNNDQMEYAAWKKQLELELNGLAGEVILVGHSFGGSVLLKYLAEEKPQKALAGLFLVATPFWGTKDWQAEYALAADFAAKLPKNLPIFFYHNRDDETAPFEQVERYAQKLPQATVRRFDKGGHQFNNDLAAVAKDIRRL